MRKATAAKSVFYHVSPKQLASGTVLQPSGNDALPAKVAEILEARRPADKISRADAVYLSETEKVSLHGLPFDKGFLHKAQCENFQRYDNAWVGILQGRHHDNPKIREFVQWKYIESADEVLADNYWAGTPTDSPNWEVLAPAATILELVGDGEVAIRGTLLK